MTDRLDRLAGGNFGDTKTVGQGVAELKINHGPGYRIYYARIGLEIVLILAGGDKNRQTADIKKAIRHLDDYKKRNGL